MHLYLGPIKMVLAPPWFASPGEGLRPAAGDNRRMLGLRVHAEKQTTVLMALHSTLAA